MVETEQKEYQIGKMDHLEFRAGYIAIACFGLQQTFKNPDISQPDVFWAFLLFLMPLYIDYIGFSPATPSVKKLCATLRITSGFLITFCVVCLLSKLMDLQPNTKGMLTFADYTGLDWVTIPVRYIWMPMLFWLFVAIVDWVCYTTVEEKARKEQIQEAIREKAKALIYESELNKQRKDANVKMRKEMNKKAAQAVRIEMDENKSVIFEEELERCREEYRDKIRKEAQQEHRREIGLEG